MKFAPPRSLPAGATPTAENMKDDETEEALMQRPDDTAEVSVYGATVTPILPCCRSLHHARTGVSCYTLA